MADATTTSERESSPPSPRPTTSPLPDRVTMPLLTLVTREAVDEDYVHAARRRAAGGRPPSPGWSGHRGAAFVTGLFGLLVAMAAVQTARNADVREASRDALISRIDEREAEVSSLERRIDAVREETADLQTTNSRTRGALAEATVQLRTLQVSTGFVAVSGPGVRITVSDNPDGSADGRVRASDLRLLVNGLWRAGAEAIAVNGRRLTALSAIVNANIAVQVNRDPLSPPYVVTAIGDRDSLQRQLAASTSGGRFQSLAAQFGFGVERQNEDEVLLPPAPDAQLPLRWAESDAGLQDNGEETP